MLSGGSAAIEDRWTGRQRRGAVYSAYGHESEILYDQGTRFRVITKTWDADLGRWLITLREVPA